jgi:tetratricopeptide (TPR) repeat protein
MCGGAGALDLRPDYGALKIEEQVRLVLGAWQDGLPRLLVFDYCEAPELLAAWRPRSGACRVLMTSRRSSWDAALGVQTLALDTLPRAQSIELLRKFRPDLAADDLDLDKIANQLGDLPLALHLAGSFLARYRHVVSPAAYLAQLQAPDLLKHRSLQGGDLSPTGHVQHVARTFALSYERLDPDEPVDAVALGLLARAAWFAPGELIPRGLLLASMALAAGEDDALKAEDALQLLANLGLLEMDAGGDVLLTRLVVRFVQGADSAQSQAAQAAVATALLREANRINKAGVPGPLLAWQVHLRHITDTVRGQASEQAARLCNELGLHLKMIGEYAAARPYYERALAITEEVLGLTHSSTALSLNNLGALLQVMGEYAAASSYFERALAIYEEVLGPTHPHTATGLNNLGYLLRAQGEVAAAKPYFERALAVREEVLGAKHPDTAQSLNNLGYLLYAQGDAAAARPYLERALAVREEVLGDTHPDIAQSLNNLGLLLRAQGEVAAARPLYERALAIREEVLGARHPDTAGSLNNLGELLRAQGEVTAARPYYERALAIFRERLGAEHPSTRMVRDNLAALVAALDR